MKNQKNRSIDINLNLIMRDGLTTPLAVSPLRLKDKRSRRRSLPKKLVRKRQEDVTIADLWEQLKADVRMQALRVSSQELIKQYFERAVKVQEGYRAQLRREEGGRRVLEEGLIERLSNQKVKLRNTLEIKEDELKEMREREKCLLQVINQLEERQKQNERENSFVSFLEEDHSKLVTLKNQTLRRRPTKI